MIPWVESQSVVVFPDPNTALTEPDGLLCAGGDLSSSTLITAYQQGIFPWYSENDPILWWSPSKRCVIYPSSIHISKSMHRFIRKSPFKVGFTDDFIDVIEACAAPRVDAEGTWITPEMIKAFSILHQKGIAKAIGLYHQEQLIGGLYGLSMGRIFFAESMFSKVPNASKLVLIWLAQQLEKAGYLFIECQNESPHLTSMGATLIKRKDYLEQIRKACKEQPLNVPWQTDGRSQ